MLNFRLHVGVFLSSSSADSCVECCLFVEWDGLPVSENESECVCAMPLGCLLSKEIRSV